MGREMFETEEAGNMDWSDRPKYAGDLPIYDVSQSQIHRAMDALNTLVN